LKKPIWNKTIPTASIADNTASGQVTDSGLVFDIRQRIGFRGPYSTTTIVASSKENINGTVFSRAIFGDNTLENIKRTTIKEVMPPATTLNFLPNEPLGERFTKGNTQHTAVTPDNKKRTPRLSMMKAGTPDPTISSASPPGVSRPREKVTPS
jgi:hypothetical protein